MHKTAHPHTELLDLLVVADEADARQWLGEFSNAQGFRVALATDGRAALALRNSTRPTAHVNAENPVVAEWLQANEQTPRDGLKSNRLQLDRLVVHRDSDSSRQPSEREQPRREQRRHLSERHSTFEITV